MTEVRLRNVDPWVVESLRAMAKKNGRSMENEIKDALYKIASAPKKKMLERLRVLREKQRREIGTLPDSTPDIRAEREEW